MMDTKEQLDQIRIQTHELRKRIVGHSVFARISSIEDVRLLMQTHVYAVWDFMSLLKSLQQGLTCTTVPWFPVGIADTRYLINEIVVGEESDQDATGKRMSHFEMYIDAMKQCGADTSGIMRFMDMLQATGNRELAFVAAQTPPEAQAFVNGTFDSIENKGVHVRAAVFAFGREELIPDMFLSMIVELDRQFPSQLGKFRYYLERHIEVDGGHHSHLALQMTSHLCGDDLTKWHDASCAIQKALELRIGLWDGVCRLLSAKQDCEVHPSD